MFQVLCCEFLFFRFSYILAQYIITELEWWVCGLISASKSRVFSSAPTRTSSKQSLRVTWVHFLDFRVMTVFNEADILSQNFVSGSMAKPKLWARAWWQPLRSSAWPLCDSKLVPRCRKTYDWPSHKSSSDLSGKMLLLFYDFAS